MHLRSLFCQGHHQDRERNKHTAYDKQIYQIVNLAVRFISSYCESHQRMKQDTQHDRTDRYQ